MALDQDAFALALKMHRDRLSLTHPDSKGRAVRKHRPAPSNQGQDK